MNQLLYSDALLEILKIIHFPQNKDTFVKEFEALNHQETLLNLVEALPREVQQILKKITDQEKLIAEIQKYVLPETYTSELIKVSGNALREFLKDIEYTLSEEQKKKIAQLLQQ